MEIKEKQIRWAASASVNCTGDYCHDPLNNLLRFSDVTLAEFRAADGQEFGDGKGAPKIAALHSSSALAINAFQHWREANKVALATALGIAPRMITSLRFEQKFPTGVGPRSPNIDVILELDDGSVFAIESKFTEWLGASGARALRDAYLEGRKFWTDVGLSGAQVIADASGPTSSFKRLDVPQLLKHMLGLATQCNQRGWHLLLLWHHCDDTAAKDMEAEIRRFQERLGRDAVRFSAMTYQEFWKRLLPLLGPDDAFYAAYMDSRYF